MAQEIALEKLLLRRGLVIKGPKFSVKYYKLINSSLSFGSTIEGFFIVLTPIKRHPKFNTRSLVLFWKRQSHITVRNNR